MADFLSKTYKFYLKNKEAIDNNRFSEEDYERYEDVLSDFDEDFYELSEKTASLIEEYAKNNPQEFCFDENGELFNTDYTGESSIYFENGQLKESIKLSNGVINGKRDTYYESGQLKSLDIYKLGKLVGEQKEWYESGKVKKVITHNPKTKAKRIEHYFENEILAKLENYDSLDNRKGIFKEWYENGNLKEQETFISHHDRTGVWLKFWNDGSKELEAEFRGGEIFYHNYWNKEGVQLLENGTGTYITNYTFFNKKESTVTEYKNYKKHGWSKVYDDGTLSSEQEYKEGIKDGFYRTYYNNGRLKEEVVYSNGNELSRKKFNKFDNPEIRTSIICLANDEVSENHSFEKVDVYAKPKNASKIAKSFKVDLSFFGSYPQDYKLFYSYVVTVDDNGKWEKSHFRMADNGQIIDEVEASIKKLEFEPAIKDGKKVESQVIIKYEFELAEKE